MFVFDAFNTWPLAAQIICAIGDLFRQWLVVAFLIQAFLGYYAEAASIHRATLSRGWIVASIVFGAVTLGMYGCHIFTTYPDETSILSYTPPVVPPIDGYQFALLHPYSFVVLVAFLFWLSFMAGRSVFSHYRYR